MRSKHRTTRKQTGFTLVEVLVALVIVAMALPALLMQIGTMANTSLHSREVMIAHWVAENKLEEIFLTQRLQRTLPRGRMSDDIQMAGETWDWTVEAEETALPDVIRLRVSVRRQGGDHWLAELSGFAIGQ